MGSDDIDQLYRVPLAEFTPARNALAKARGKDGAEVKQLQKPSVPAWAVNQLYWRDRDLYDRLVQSSERLREAHRRLLAGKPNDLRETEAAHRDAVKAALDRTRDLLTAAGESATPATMNAVSETLSALPSGDAPGRLTRPLKPLGFEALSGATISPAAAQRASFRVVARSPEQQQRDAEKAREEERARAQAEKEEHERQRQAQKELRAAEAALEKAEEAVRKAQETLERLQQARGEALNAVRRARLRVR